MRIALPRRSRALAVPLAILLLTTPGALTAQDGGFTWENTTELSFVSTSGNASSSTLGLKASLIGTGGQNSFKIEVGGIRSETHTTTRTATGTTGSYTISETTTSQLTAESYFARARYDRSLGPAFLFAGFGWDRNTFAGVQNRYAFVSGVGRTWVDSDAGRFKTDVGATYTIQKDVDPAPDADEGFAGFRASIDARRQITEGSSYSTTLVADQNAERSKDFRADWINSLSFQLTEALAFKTSLQLLYDRQPSLIPVPLFDTGGTQTGTVLEPGDNLDSVLTVTLVITL